MPQIDKRIIYMDLETPSGIKRLEDLNIEYTISKTGGTTMNEAEIRVANLSRDLRNYLVTTTSPLSKPCSEKIVRVYAGYESTGVSRRFVGCVTRATPSQPSDIWITMKARTGSFSSRTTLARNAPSHANLSILAKSIAEDLGLILDFQAEDKTVGNYSFSGPALKQVNKLAEAGHVEVFVDDDKLILKDRGAPLAPGGVRRDLKKAASSTVA